MCRDSRGKEIQNDRNFMSKRQHHQRTSHPWNAASIMLFKSMGGSRHSLALSLHLCVDLHGQLEVIGRRDVWISVWMLQLILLASHAAEL